MEIEIVAAAAAAAAHQQFRNKHYLYLYDVNCIISYAFVLNNVVPVKSAA